MRPLDTPAPARPTIDVWEIALGFMDAQMLLVADELRVFDALDGEPRTPEELAESVGLPPDSAARLLVALSALGLARRRPDGRWENGPDAAATLVRGRPGYVGAMFQHVRDELYPLWGQFRHALAEGRAQWERAFPARPLAHERVHTDPAALRRFMEGMHAITYRSGAELASMAAELKEIRRIVDVGGASGAFLIALAEAHPRLRGTVFDLPQVGPIAGDSVRRAGLSDRIGFRGGDFWADDLPAGADAYSLGFILHDWDDDGQRILLDRVARACPPGGLLIVGEYLLNDDKTGPLWAARSDLNMLAAARGRERSAPEYAEFIRPFGFEPARIYHTAGAKKFMLFRRTGGARAGE